MKLKTAVVALTICLLPGMSWAAAPSQDDPAQMDPGKAGTENEMGYHHWEHGDNQPILNKLNLSAAQKQKIDTIKSEERSTVHPLFNEMIEKKQALNEYLSNPKATTTEAYTKQGEITDIGDKIGKAHIDASLKIKNVLTPQQQQKFATLVREKTQEMEQHHPGMHRMMRHGAEAGSGETGTSPAGGTEKP